MLSSLTCGNGFGHSAAKALRNASTTILRVGPHFRAGVVIVVQNTRGEVLAFERTDSPGSWQLPQGGIDDGESSFEAAARELREETGLTEREVELTEQSDGWTVYELPAGFRKQSAIGQAHRWFRGTICDDAIVPSPDGSEFSRWKWMMPSELVDDVIEFRRDGYRQQLLDATRWRDV